MKASTNTMMKSFSNQQDIETQPSPSFTNSKQKNLKIVIESFPKGINPTCFNDQDDETVYIQGLMEEYNKRSGQKCSYFEQGDICHVCNIRMDLKFLKHCGSSKCGRSFCLRCLDKTLKIPFEKLCSMMKGAFWRCSVCEGVCPCTVCKGRTKNLSNYKFCKRNLKYEDENGVLFKRRNQNGNIIKIDSTESSNSDESHHQPECLDINTVAQNNNQATCKKRGIKIKSIHSLIASGRRPGFGKKCHLCNESKLLQDIAACSRRYCKNRFCLTCIEKHFQKELGLVYDYGKYWICFSCTGLCKCGNCKTPETLTAFHETRSTVYLNNSDTVSKTEFLKDQNPSNQQFGKVTRLKKIENKEQTNHLSSSNAGKSVFAVVQDEECKTITKTKVESRDASPEKSLVLDKEIIDNSKILLEIQIDSAFITLYDAESEDQLKTEVQSKLNIPQLC